MGLSFHLYSDKINYDLIRADSVSVIGSISNGKTEIQKFTFGYADGVVSLEGDFTGNDDKTVTGNVISSASGINMNQLLCSFRNFGQSFLTAESTLGNVSWTADMHFVLDSNLETIDEENFWKFDFTVTEAQLSNVEPIEKALSFIRQKSKENILISNLHFSTYYVSRKLYIQNVTVKNSISDMNIFGTYSPNDTLLDLNLKLSLTDLLFKSMKKRIIETEDGVFDMGDGRDMNLKFTGTLGQHQVKLATRKEFDRNLDKMHSQFIQFDKELNDK